MVKKPLALLVLLLATATGALCQEQGAPVPEQKWQTRFSLELGTGLQPLHMELSPTVDRREALAAKGQEVNREGAFYPVISLSGVWRLKPRTELLLTGGVSWCHHRLTQYDSFGTDPSGRPRYNLSQGRDAGWTNSSPFFTLTVQYRHLWNPDAAVKLHSGAGLGVVFNTSGALILPELTPIGLRYGGRHIYGFVELTLGPVASIVHGGLGWAF